MDRKVKEDIVIRPATIDDAEAILKIYQYYILHTAISFEYQVPALEEFENRIRNTIKKYPYFVAEKNKKIVGYTYAGPFIHRAAYDWSAETTIYLEPGITKCGIGRTLYETLECALKEMGILNLYACIGYPSEKDDEYINKNSAEFHKHLGFKKTGEFYKCGYKFNRWYNMIWMEKIIGKHEDLTV